MSESLSEIDPNMDNGDEGKAFIKMMYKLRDVKIDRNNSAMPVTPIECVEDVAGKVIQIENLQEDIDKQKSLNSFFAEVYCSAYTNSLLTLRDGLSQIFPGGLDGPIEDELTRLGATDETMDKMEIEEAGKYIDQVKGGTFQRDDSPLIKEVQPLKKAIELCGDYTKPAIKIAKEQRKNYLDDLNFLRFLKSM